VALSRPLERGRGLSLVGALILAAVAAGLVGCGGSSELSAHVYADPIVKPTLASGEIT
jgi:hypothetical protein